MRIITRSGLKRLATTAVLATLSVAAPASAQYMPYTPQQQYAAPQQQYAAPQQQYGPAQPQYAARGAYQGYTAPQAGYVPQTPIGAPAQGYGQNYGPYTAPHMAMNYQPAGSPTPTAAPAETLPLTPPVESVPAGAIQGGAYVPQPTPAADNYGYGSYAPGAGYESYPAAQSQAGCATGNCNMGYGASCTAPYGACDTYSNCGDMSGCISKGAGCGYWFGGVYGLLMDRDNANKYPLVFTAPNTPAYGYYPQSNQVVLRNRDADIGFQGGAEFRLGRTFGCGGGCGNPCDPCGGCGCSMGPRWGLEGVYWQIFEQSATAQYVDSGTIRTYSMMPMGGLQYNPGTGYRPVNDYFDYAPPVADHTAGGDILVTLARVQSSFQVQNVEVNLLRLGVCGGGNFGPAAYSVASGPGAAGGSCGSCAMSGCDAGCGGCNTCGPVGPRYSCVGVCGFRWMQFDESFLYGVDFQNQTSLATGYLNYCANTTNNLFGAQIGCNGVYRIGCKWGLHLAPLVGIYGNDISTRQYMQSPTGDVIFGTTGENFDVMANKTDVSMIGELRAGLSYQATCHLGLYGGWRAIGVTGLALATDQNPAQFNDPAALRNYVNSNNSLILHGLQAGVTWNY